MERNRIRYYIESRLNLTGRDEEAFFTAISDSYDLRIGIVHRANMDIVADQAVGRLAKAVGSMLWVELGFPLGGSPAVLLTSS